MRSKIVKEHLNDPAFYERMSALLDGIIKLRKERAQEYEQYLQRIAQLVQQVEAGRADDAPMELTTPGRRALYNNLQPWLAAKPFHHVAETAPALVVIRAILHWHWRCASTISSRQFGRMHLLEPTHNDRFKALMRTFLPEWEDRRRELNQLPVRHEQWHY